MTVIISLLVVMWKANFSPHTSAKYNIADIFFAKFRFIWNFVKELVLIFNFEFNLIKTDPTNNGLLLSFRLSSNAEILLISTD